MRSKQEDLDDLTEGVRSLNTAPAPDVNLASGAPGLSHSGRDRILSEPRLRSGDLGQRGWYHPLAASLERGLDGRVERINVMRVRDGKTSVEGLGYVKG